MNVDDVTFRIHVYSIEMNAMCDFYCGGGELGLLIANRQLSAAASDPTVDNLSIQYAPILQIIKWDFDENSLPHSSIDEFTWIFLSDTNAITGDWIPYGGAMMDGAAGFNLLKPLIKSLEGYEDDHARNMTLGYAPIANWADWGMPGERKS